LLSRRLQRGVRVVRLVEVRLELRELLLRRVQLHADLLAAAFLFLLTTPTWEGGREWGEGKN
jgi:hypothetical protein